MPNSNSPRSRQARIAAVNNRRNAIIAAGGRHLSLVLSPEATEALRALTQDRTIVAAVEEALIEAARKRR